MAQVDRNAEFVMLDFASGPRLTHYPSGDTALRHPWMHGRDAAKWVARVREFMDAHPGARTVCNARWDVIDDLSDHPLSGGSFAVGDSVVTRREGIGEVDCVREVIAVRHHGPEAHLDPDDARESYVLDDGEILYWSTGHHGWVADARNSDRDARARRPLPGESLEALRYPAEEMLRKATAGAARRLARLAEYGPLGTAFGSAGDCDAFRDEAAGLAEALSADSAVLAAHVEEAGRAWRPEALPDADVAGPAGRLERAGILARQAMDLPEAERIGLRSMGMGLDEVERVAEAVCGTLRRRGDIEPEASPSP